MNASDVTEITKIERQHCVYADVCVGKDCTKHRIDKTPDVALSFRPCKCVLICLKPIRAIVKEFCSRRAHNALKTCNRFRLPCEPRVEGFIQNWPRHDNGKHFQPFLFFTSRSMMLVSRVEESNKEARVYQKRVIGSPAHRRALRVFRIHPRERFSVCQLRSDP